MINATTESTTPPLQSHLMTLTNICLILRTSATAYVHAATTVTESHTYWPKSTNQRCGVDDDKYKIWGVGALLHFKIYTGVALQYYIAHFFFKHSRSLIISPNLISISTVAADWVKVIRGVGQHVGYHCCLTEFESSTWTFWSLDVFHMSVWVNWCSVSLR